MDGITILREVVKNYDYVCFFIGAGTLFILSAIIYIFCKVHKIQGEGEGDFLIVSGSCAIIFLIFGLVFLKEYKTAPKQYDILVDDFVTVNEFFEHYELEKIDGEIYTVEEIRSID